MFRGGKGDREGSRIRKTGNPTGRKKSKCGYEESEFN